MSRMMINDPVYMGLVGYVGEDTDLKDLGRVLRNLHRGWHADSTYAPGPQRSERGVMGTQVGLFGSKKRRRREEAAKLAAEAEAEGVLGLVLAEGFVGDVLRFTRSGGFVSDVLRFTRSGGLVAVGRAW